MVRGIHGPPVHSAHIGTPDAPPQLFLMRNGRWPNCRARCSPRDQRVYGLDRTEPNVIPVYYLGGGSTDVEDVTAHSSRTLG